MVFSSTIIKNYTVLLLVLRIYIELCLKLISVQVSTKGYQNGYTLASQVKTLGLSSTFRLIL